MPCGDWSKTFEMTQSSCAQKASCCALSAKPEASTGTLKDLPSEARVTLYSTVAVVKEAKSARTVECAATQGLPAAARMSQGRGPAAAAAAEEEASAAAPRASTRGARDVGILFNGGSSFEVAWWRRSRRAAPPTGAALSAQVE